MPMQTSGDQFVDAKSILEAISELKRRGRDAVMKELESIERELASHVMEELGLIHQGLLNTGASAKFVRRLHAQIESLTLVSILALRKAHYRLWQESTEGTQLAKLDSGATE